MQKRETEREQQKKVVQKNKILKDSLIRFWVKNLTFIFYDFLQIQTKKYNFQEIKHNIRFLEYYILIMEKLGNHKKVMITTGSKPGREKTP